MIAKLSAKGHLFKYEIQLKKALQNLIKLDKNEFLAASKGEFSRTTKATLKNYTITKINI
jgi:hypothetical protein